MLDLIKLWNKTHDLNEDETLHAYDVVCDRIRSLRKYSDKSKYPESYSERKFDNLKELTKNEKDIIRFSNITILPYHLFSDAVF